ncbi:MAG: sodium:proton antiporter [Lachnospiraceae bacterium]|nr:sodium:proton antiporter [Lachnospiraceae bacterium]
MNVLLFLIIILAFIVCIGILNEKLFHLQSDIALILFSLVIALLLMGADRLFDWPILHDFIGRVGEFGFEKYLMDGVLCFMLFAGASKVNMGKFKQNLRPICLLAFLTTAISSVIYGLLFFAVAMLFHIPVDIWMCILLGCVVSPTDPIAATGILSKIGLSKNVCSVIENESLFNDGTGVTLFVFVRSIVIHSGEDNFVILMCKEIVGAVAVALLVSFVLFSLMKTTKDPVRYILISLFDVALVYIICEELGFSGVIASVVCGMYFSYAMDQMERRVCVIDPKEYYKDFWEILENILNAVLFVMIGLYVFDVEISSYAAVVIPAAIVILLLSRVIGVLISTLLGGRRIPGNYDLREFVVLMVWSALKGGLSLALAIQTEAFLSPEVYRIFINVTYVTIFFSVLVQGLTIRKVYFKLEEHKAARTRQDGRKESGC